MSAAAAIADAASLPDWERDLLNRQLARLERLADSAERVVAEFEARIVAPGPGLSPAERRHAGLDYDRAARALRMTLALQSKLVRDARTPAAANDDEDDEIKPGDLQVIWPKRATDLEAGAVRATVRAAAEAQHLDPGDTERLVAEAAERLDLLDVQFDLAWRPFDVVVAMICRDLGLPVDAHQARPPPLAGEGGGMLVNDLASGRTPAEERAGEGVETACRAADAQTHDPPCAQPP